MGGMLLEIFKEMLLYVPIYPSQFIDILEIGSFRVILFNYCEGDGMGWDMRLFWYESLMLCYCMCYSCTERENGESTSVEEKMVFDSRINYI